MNNFIFGETTSTYSIRLIDIKASLHHIGC